MLIYFIRPVAPSVTMFTGNPTYRVMDVRRARRAFTSAQIEQHKGHVLLTADIPPELLRANANSH
ncbi:MAG: hypothetical protein INR71_14765 [Terriglobus roseus]|nr:hypothetical protein [Terriglobus roseus]